MPLGADVVDVAQDAALDRVHRLVVEDVVVPLVAGGQVPPGLLGNAGHLLALVDAVAHELLGDDVQPGPHGGHRHDAVQVQGRGDDHPFQAVGLGVGDQLAVVGVDLDVPARFVLGLPAVLGQQPRADLEQFGLGVVAVEGAVLVVGTDVGDRRTLGGTRG